MKYCPKCGETRKRERFSKHKRMKDGLQSQCKECIKEKTKKNTEDVVAYRKRYHLKNRSKRLAYAKEYYQKYKDERDLYGKESNPNYEEEKAEYSKRYVLRTRYGITLEEYTEMLDEQEGGCAICKKECNTGYRLAVDHCHTTGKIRGLLCGNCNTGIGKLGDTSSTVYKAYEYLQKAEEDA